MKTTISIFCFFLFSVNLSAQLRLGMKLETPTFSAQETTKQFWNRDAGKLYDVNYLATRTTMAYGLSFHTDFKPGWLSADILYRKRTVQYNIEQQAVLSRSLYKMEDNFTELRIPVLAGIRKNDFKIGLGPVFNFQLDNDHGLTTLEGFTSTPRKLNTGFQFMVGYVIKDRIHIDLKREIGFNQVGESYRAMGKFINLGTRTKTTSLTIGAYF